MKIDNRLKKRNKEIVDTYVYYLDLIFKKATKIPFEIINSNRVTELIVEEDSNSFRFKDDSKATVVRLVNSQNINNQQLDDCIKNLSKQKAMQIIKQYQKHINTYQSTTTLDKDLITKNLSEAVEINTRYLENKYKLELNHDIIFASNNDIYVHFNSKILTALFNQIPDFKLSDEQLELMLKENDNNAIESVSSAIYSWIMNSLEATTKLVLMNQDDLKDMLKTFAQITNAKSVEVINNSGNLCIKYDNKLSDTFLVISSDPQYLKSLIKDC